MPISLITLEVFFASTLTCSSRSFFEGRCVEDALALIVDARFFTRFLGGALLPGGVCDFEILAVSLPTTALPSCLPASELLAFLFRMFDKFILCIQVPVLVPVL